ncbi:U11/U12 small nuclear ribonucleoprotein 35 kDa protein [Aplysia californica]|uniref:U11/U12 small nuclear ribonucleoprotein 35 kDa protein n=1 Tax=Aplysia californica TaxID=6500 RepID=A0ABM0JAD3_APLCA|nr:U11/U12 small nuclear ribonucleoprotein 35 kDa protein [Aplysia californica]XP_005089106.1 U11/U12 small nuclear ribonucleoprotein 35 kDa protein [Aplysia californica]XP_005113525.1 U11/U12 small nuclear ribonucleoprotein 35 kDa protein [Aplysia californica]
MASFCPVFVDKYDPLKAGSIDGTDEYPHDKGVVRALNAVYKPNRFVKGAPECTVFVGRLNPNTVEETIEDSLKDFGKILSVRIVRDIVTGFSKCYGFVEFSDPYEARDACKNGNKIVIDDHEILVDSEKERTLKGWIPRRLGGGIGGKRESGQLRFGGKDRPFKKPIQTLHQAQDYKDFGFKDYSRNSRRDKGRDDYQNRNRDRYR